MSRTKRGQSKYWWAGPRNNISKNWKWFTKRRHRVKERMLISQERWDELGNKSYQRAEDVWQWD